MNDGGEEWLPMVDVHGGGVYGVHRGGGADGGRTEREQRRWYECKILGTHTQRATNMLLF